MSSRSFVAFWAAALSVSLTIGCARAPRDTPNPVVSASAPTSAGSNTVPLDHLAPGELQASADMAFGFPIPVTMKVVQAFSDEVHLMGEVELQGLVRYVQEHTLTTAPELQGNTLVFGVVRMRRGAPDRTFRFEIVGKGRLVSLRVKDTTSAAATEPERISDEERWRRAGYKPNGEPLDVGQLK